MPALPKMPPRTATKIQSDALRALTGVTHGFYTRHGGVSQGVYATLNCGFGSHDDPRHVDANMTAVAHDLGLEPARLGTLYQVHSATAVIVDATPDRTLQADALVTRTRGLGLGIKTADCVPVLLCDPVAEVIGAAHAGWKGALGGVIEDTLDKMATLGARAAEIRAAIGPCIRQPSYEVGAEIFQTVLAQDADNSEFFVASLKDHHFMFDLSGYVAKRLRRAGVGTVDDVQVDTYAREDLLFSYRRMTHRGEPDYGRQISVIALR